jgi:23S rRNA G2445 N2-methylase RlmL
VRPWRFLVSTNRGLEAIASAELAELGLDQPEKLYPGMVECAGPPQAIPRLNTDGRTIHRVLLELGRGDCHSLAEIATLVQRVDLPRYLDTDQSFAVRAQRRGGHPFESPDVESRVGQAIVESYEGNDRPPVNLDTPDSIVRVFVREELTIVTLDTTGQRSLHRRQQRVVEHEAPIRPTMAAAMYRLADPRSGEVVVDPMCGCGTIPLEIAATELGRPVDIGRERAFERLRWPEIEGGDEPTTQRRESRDVTIVGGDIDASAVAGTQRNTHSSGFAGDLSLAVADARTEWVDADVVVTDLPFGHRTGGDIRPLYADFARQLAESSCRRAVIHTTRANLLDGDPSQRFEMRRGRLESDLLVFDY